MPETQWMTLLETADLMKRLPTQVTRMCEDGKLEYYREDGRYFVSRESIDLFMHPRAGASTTRQTGEPEVDLEDASAGAESPTASMQGANGSSRRKYGRPPEEIGASSQTAPESETEEASESVDQLPQGDPHEAAEEPIETLDAVDEFETSEEPDAVDAQEAAEEPEAMEALEPVDENAEATGNEEEINAAAQLLTESENALAEPVDEIQRTEETQIYGDTGSEQPTREADQEVSTMIPEGSTQQVTEILADLREAIARHAEVQRAFSDEVSSLADALENTLSSGEDKTNELTREISSLLARYTKR